MTKQRIAYIDFMKGLCIILVVAFHINHSVIGDHLNGMLQQFRMPMYFFLSGLFFKLYDGFWDFTRHKVNNIIIPTIFFLLIGFTYATLRGLAFNNFDFSAAFHSLPSNPIHLNAPLWFLIVLFEVNIIYYLLQKFLPRWLTIVSAILLSAIGYYIVDSGYYVQPYLDIAMIAMPFFVLGSESRKNGLLTNGPKLWISCAFAIFTLIILYYFASEINMSHRVYPNYFLLYLLPCLAIMSLLFLCQYIKRPVPIISYVGRYSIIVLGTHYFVLFPIKALISSLLPPPTIDEIQLFLLTLLCTLALEFPIIYFLKKYLPRFTAQQEFFTTGWKIAK
ncbi:MAG: acyltransferase [Muribaculaceae bacterium]|nr:acyltransferase [Muribaculaceae bacterium]